MNHEPPKAPDRSLQASQDPEMVRQYFVDSYKYYRWQAEVQANYPYVSRDI